MNLNEAIQILSLVATGMTGRPDVDIIRAGGEVQYDSVCLFGLTGELSLFIYYNGDEGVWMLECVRESVETIYIEPIQAGFIAQQIAEAIGAYYE